MTAIMSRELAYQSVNLKKAFTALDFNNDQTVDTAELHRGLSQVHQGSNDQALLHLCTTLMSRLDPTGRGSITFPQFEQAMRKIMRQEAEKIATTTQKAKEAVKLKL